jgi:hypothetical protein
MSTVSSITPINSRIFSSLKKISRNLARPTFLVAEVLLPLVVLTLYFVSFAYLLSDILGLPIGVNYLFVSRSWRYLLYPVAGIALSSFILFRRRQITGQVLVSKSFITQLSIGDLLLILLPLTPVVQYVLNNQEVLSPSESLYTISAFFLLSGLYVFIIPVLFRFVKSAPMLICLGLAFVSTITSMAMLSSISRWYEEGSLKIQWIFLTATFLITWVLFNLPDKRILRGLIIVVFIANSVSQLLSPTEELAKKSPALSDASLLNLIAGRVPVSTPNIYLLVYDAYVPNETMRGYGIDNSAQEEYLKNSDFVLYPGTYSIASHTLGTMSRVLNASTDFYGSERRAVSGDGVVHNILRHLGYESYGIFPFDYFFQTNVSQYDFSFPKSNDSSPEILSGILMGEFRFDLGFDKVSRQDFIETKQHVFEEMSSNRAFIYAHSISPGHSQNSGSCRSNETLRYAKRLRRANVEMRQDIEAVIRNDPAAIIIVAGDHGPYLTKNCSPTGDEYDISEISRFDIQDRYGTFLAIRWPTGEYVGYDDITVLQDVFPAVFAYLYRDAGLLESRVEPRTLDPQMISGATIKNNIIYGGLDNGEPVFVEGR